VGRAPADFAIGKHSGSAGVRASLQAGGISVPALLCAEIVSAVRRLSRAKKGSVSTRELAAIARQLSQDRRLHQHADIRT
jgi:isopropylmalate/homocitrate/citramalate synthase